MARLALDVDHPLMGVDDFLGYGEPDPGTGGLGGEEGEEKAFPDFGGNPSARIPDPDDREALAVLFRDRADRLKIGCDLQITSPPHGVEGVGDEIVKDLTKLNSIRPQAGDLRVVGLLYLHATGRP